MPSRDVDMVQSASTHLDGTSCMKNGAAAATIDGQRNCSTSASDSGISVTDQNSRETEAKLHSPRKTRKACLHPTTLEWN